jgi:hypothetical protein
MKLLKAVWEVMKWSWRFECAWDRVFQAVLDHDRQAAVKALQEISSISVERKQARENLARVCSYLRIRWRTS